MKKQFIAVLIFIIPIFLSFSTEKGIIKSVQGKVEIYISGKWIKAEIGMELLPGNLISTGFKSNAVIDTGSSNIFIKQLTRMSLDELSKSGDTVKTNLNLRLRQSQSKCKDIGRS